MEKIINKIKSALSKAFGSALTYLVDRGEVAIKVTNILKSVVQSPVTGFLVSLTPTKSDDILLAKAKILVPSVAVNVALAMSIIKEADLVAGDPDQALALILDRIRLHLPEEGKAIFYRELSGKIAEALSDGRLSSAEAVGIVQLVFKKRL
jgi:hypothetical protein